jgi:cysteine-rich repeat protein
MNRSVKLFGLILFGMVLSLSFVSALWPFDTDWWPFGPKIQFSPGVCGECPSITTAGDANNDCAIDISDPQYIQAWKFSGGPGFCDEVHADANGDGTVDISDSQYLFAWLFSGGPKPVDLPGEEPVEPTPTGCSQYASEYTCLFDNSCRWDGSNCVDDSVEEELPAEQKCGNGDIEGNEVCDDGPLNGQPNKCNTLCDGITSGTCNNGIVEPEEECDDGNTFRDDTCASCKITFCGDAFTQSPNGKGVNELCDANQRSCTTNDGYLGSQDCAVSCLEYNECIPSESCGDGIRNGNEFCDSGINNGKPNNCNLECSEVISAEPACLDTDGGANFEEFGYVNVTNKTDYEKKYNDVCNGDLLIEYICVELEAQSQSYSCPYGCDLGACNPKLIPGKLFKVTKIINRTEGYGNDLVRLVDIVTKEVFDAVITSEGIGIVTMGGRDYNVQYISKPIGFDFEKYIEIESSPDIPASKLIKSQKVFVNSHVVMGNPVHTDRILKVQQIENLSNSYAQDRVVLYDNLADETFIVIISSEGRGIVSIDGLSYNINYFGSSTSSIFDRYIEIRKADSMQYVFNFAYIVLPLEQPVFDCGNGIVENFEWCDDGPLNGQPGKCNNECEETVPAKVDFDDDGASQDSPVTGAECGNDIVEIGEGCDDGNNENGDGCSSICEIETINKIPGEVLDEEPVGCEITGASWSVKETTVGSRVTLSVTGNIETCWGKSVSFDVFEDDLIGDDPVNVKPNNAEFLYGVATTSWIVEDIGDLFGNPEFYFIASLVENPGVTKRSNLLFVLDASNAGIGVEFGPVADKQTFNLIKGVAGDAWIDYYCGRSDTFTDGIGNVYGPEKAIEYRLDLGDVGVC